MHLKRQLKRRVRRLDLDRAPALALLIPRNKTPDLPAPDRGEPHVALAPAARGVLDRGPLDLRAEEHGREQVERALVRLVERDPGGRVGRVRVEGEGGGDGRVDEGEVERGVGGADVDGVLAVRVGGGVGRERDGALDAAEGDG